MNFFDYIHKSPHRNQLEKYFRTFLPQFEGPILDIGSKNRRYDSFLKERPVAIDIVENKDKGVSEGNILCLDFIDQSFESVVCLEVLEYVLNTDKAIGEVSRVLKKGGVFSFSIPFMYREHQDAVRYTKIGLQEILSKYFSDIAIYPVGNCYTIILDIIRGHIIKTGFKSLRYFYYALYLPWVLFIPLSKSFRDDSFASGYFVIAKK